MRKPSADRVLTALMGLVSLFVGASLALVAYVLAGKIGEDHRATLDRRVTAVVFDKRVVNEGGGPNGGTRTDTLVRYELGDKRYTSRLRRGSSGGEVGDTVEVAYDSERPDRPYTVAYAESEPPSDASRITGVVLFSLFALAMLGGGALLLLTGGDL
ncbi:hypothetical protein CIB93_01505 [Streptomyces sp. WZ.A104]|uniref:DUF3592 domain-containing protein n=1 Tax=Streptomyces sp. WZ.A104 TaxID=2023771 RepID=UPI000BBB9F04|nr:DUF3592 domain-containing protein [Streptomyces sp. WZ.A104]PCG87751.1 hypothetical protein CIB93_01505 [Streptomyces sp. WZ.A104]